MKKLQISFAILLLTISLVSFASAAKMDDNMAGTIPGDFFYGFDKFFDSVDVALTLDPAKRAEKSIDKANERLAEFEIAMKNGENEDAKKASKDYSKYMKKVTDLSADLSKKGTEGSMFDLAVIDNKLKDHEMNFDDFDGFGDVKDGENAKFDSLINMRESFNGAVDSTNDGTQSLRDTLLSTDEFDDSELEERLIDFEKKSGIEGDKVYRIEQAVDEYQEIAQEKETSFEVMEAEFNTMLESDAEPEEFAEKFAEFADDQARSEDILEGMEEEIAKKVQEIKDAKTQKDVIEKISYGDNGMFGPDAMKNFDRNLEDIKGNLGASTEYSEGRDDPDYWVNNGRQSDLSNKYAHFGLQSGQDLKETFSQDMRKAMGAGEANAYISDMMSKLRAYHADNPEKPDVKPEHPTAGMDGNNWRAARDQYMKDNGYTKPEYGGPELDVHDYDGVDVPDYGNLNDMTEEELIEFYKNYKN